MVTLVPLVQYRKLLIKMHEFMKKLKTKSNLKYSTAIVKLKDFLIILVYKATQLT